MLDNIAAVLLMPKTGKKTIYGACAYKNSSLTDTFD